MNFLNFWACKYILRKNASILMADMYNHGLAETAVLIQLKIHIIARIFFQMSEV